MTHAEELGSSIQVNYHGYDMYPVLPGMPDVVMDDAEILECSDAEYGLRLAANDATTACEIWDEGRQQYVIGASRRQSEESEEVYFTFRNRTGRQIIEAKVLPAIVKAVLFEAPLAPVRTASV